MAQKKTKKRKQPRRRVPKIPAAHGRQGLVSLDAQNLVRAMVLGDVLQRPRVAKVSSPALGCGAPPRPAPGGGGAYPAARQTEAPKPPPVKETAPARQPAVPKPQPAGKPRQVICPGCKRSLPAGAKFCPFCRTRLE